MTQLLLLELGNGCGELKYWLFVARSLAVSLLLKLIVAEWRLLEEASNNILLLYLAISVSQNVSEFREVSRLCFVPLGMCLLLKNFNLFRGTYERILDQLTRMKSFLAEGRDQHGTSSDLLNCLH